MSLKLDTTYLRLRADAPAEPLPVDASFWPKLMSGELGNFHNEYLVTLLSFDSDWKGWERHPNGDEIVVLLEGAVSFVLELDGKHEETALDEAGAYAIVPRGTWHTARVHRPARMLFITPGEGTETRGAIAARSLAASNPSIAIE
jgi:mannose-6-phosphate isomerase-like protein (cupin superfamily)